MLQAMRIQAYPVEIEKQMRNFYNSLSEKPRRCYAAVEATKLVPQPLNVTNNS